MFKNYTCNNDIMSVTSGQCDRSLPFRVFIVYIICGGVLDDYAFLAELYYRYLEYRNSANIERLAGVVSQRKYTSMIDTNLFSSTSDSYCLYLYNMRWSCFGSSEELTVSIPVL